MLKKNTEARAESGSQLVVLEGAPSVGKMTVANELAQLTGYRSFHNHLSQDLAGVLYPEWNQRRFDLVDKLRITAFRAAAENGTDILFTYVYGGTPNETTFFDDTVSLFEDHGGAVHFVHLFAAPDAQEARVNSPIRKEFGKITDIEHLQKRMGEYAHNPPFPYTFDASFDTTVILPKQTAVEIRDALKLL